MSDLDETRLAAWASAQVPGFTGPVTVTKFPGGQSNPTYRVESTSGAYVLRRKPFGTILPSAHAVEREYRLIAALHPAGFPVARPYALCEDRQVIGAPFYLMEMVEGRTFWDGSLPEMAPAARTAIYEAIVDTLAALHRIDPETVGLGDYGRPGNYFARQVERWTRQYRASQTDDLPEVESLIDFLPRTVPPQTQTSIVHGDYRIDNMIFAADRPQVLAVLDWELSTLGDPLADFSYFLMNWVTEPEGRSGVKGLAGPETGIPTIEAMVARYCAATGRDGVPDLDWYFAYNLFRLTGIVQGIKKRMLDGNASSTQAANTVERLPGLASAAWHFAQRAGE
ncbi:phosphotransferase family protein [Sphingomonas sp. ABOLD]|uniref:Aminoglycoside phosphotransferase (APT) family kinase protein n=1 Tax=Sphingomonas trueperi TaxID=53317 RepID=A0A7X5XYC7_9SPHN|nr:MULTISPECIES: phosphotransferase family protein [Sphingomonas]NJB97228.1 aminoglycoside phosphotransferase (APT) family kinase protein [Sphingomonas trueperi]RSV49327.1 phosphotransferase family protein [Sphingomonas sp. ABOLD]